MPRLPRMRRLAAFLLILVLLPGLLSLASGTVRAADAAPASLPAPDTTGATRPPTASHWRRLPPAHRANLLLHVVAGTFAIGIGVLVLVAPKGTARHRRVGRWYVAATALVVLSAAAGIVLFRALPTFAALTLLVGYQVLGGWRDARTRGAGPAGFDAVATGAACMLGIVLGRPLLVGGAEMPALAALGALAMVLAWDAVRWTFPWHWHGTVWRYAHGYKLNAALWGMVSALAGNVLRSAQPWSQLVPIALGGLVIGVMFLRMARGAAPARLRARVSARA